MKRNIDFSANGKLLLSGEYLVLAGAEALAFPVRFGQKLRVSVTNLPRISWISREVGADWFSCVFSPDDLKIISSTDVTIAHQLRKLLRAARNLQSSFLADGSGLEITADANYPLKWGLGSSSTLISLVSQWSGADPFELFRQLSGGSGYDIACATRKDLLVYRLSDLQPLMRRVSPGRALQENTCFAYLGNKQETAKEVASFLTCKNFNQSDIERISELSGLICSSEGASDLIALVEEHEAIIGRILKRDRLASRFPAFPGTVKSLGAWGGDFGMFVSGLSNLEIKEWLIKEGFPNAFTYGDMKIPG